MQLGEKHGYKLFVNDMSISSLKFINIRMLVSRPISLFLSTLATIFKFILVFTNIKLSQRYLLPKFSSTDLKQTFLTLF